MARRKLKYENRFLAEAQPVDLSLLDSCHHKVISQLHTTCADLAEEELAKLGVGLFNCQAGAEGRRTYLCTEDMSLAECTAGMDPDTWNAYHIISNRARAVCYATRQVEFKRRAQHMVNALVSTAVGQLEAMETLKRSQEELKQLTAESLQRVVSAQEGLLSQQETLRGGQAQMEEALSGNLERLVQEKALIASGQREVAELLEGITRRMENVSSHLNQQDVELQEGHQSILRDLSQVQRRAQEVYSKLDTNVGLFLAHQKQTTLYHDELLGKLRKMNETFGLALQTMELMQTKVEGRLQHIQRFITWAGFSLSSVYTCVLHVLYFLLAALIMTFLQIPGASRALLLVVVVANALFELHHTVSLGFTSLTGLLALEGEVGLLHELEKLEEVSYLSVASERTGADDVRQQPQPAGPSTDALWGSVARCQQFKEVTYELDGWPTAEEAMHSSCSASPRPFCQGVTRTGQPCRKKSLSHQVFCHVHAAGHSHLA
ncbi:protein brambleberry-like [Protobothrops mucrosquamatus]|uniref:protein brambleberry-like n=1 Tax=Protobothrops mucrosquamatus TaxID=103944 RepID=UPI0010FB0CBF|nr:protein brambleberry-like [Protobothrops mucrosquamatus]